VGLFVGMAVIAGIVQAQQQGFRVQIAEDASFRAPSGWIAAEPAYRNATQLTKVRGEGSKTERIAHLLVTSEVHPSHDAAIARLRDIAAESTATVKATTIAGWPAIERQVVVELPRTERDELVQKHHDVEPARGIAVTVAVAVDTLVVRFEGATFSQRDKASADEMRSTASTLIAGVRADPNRTKAEVVNLQKTARPTPSRKNGGAREPGRGAAAAPSSASGGATPAAALLTLPGGGGGGGPAAVSAQVQNGVGELEVAVTNGGKDVVIAANSGWSRSHDGGVSFTFGGPTPGTFPRDGDPSLAVGQSGNIYYAFIGFPDGSAGAGGVTGCTDSVARSTDGGATFPFLSHAVFCPFTSSSLCFPDQEHIGADRVNAPTGDQLYVVWRQFSPAGSPANCGQIGSGFVTPSIVCSSDGGANWSAPTAIGAGDRPRVAVGRDGAVYVTYRAGASVMLRRFSSCGAGLVPQPPVTVDSGATEVACPMAGLDRCNSFSSPTVAPDDQDANHLYLGYAVNTSAANDNVIVRQSTDGGATWSPPATLNSGVTARRFMPWMCSVCGTVQAGWYDRRASTPGAVDRTDYFRGSASRVGGTLQTGSELNLTNAPDPQCATGWPCSVDAPGGSELCNAQPQLGGRCRTSTGGSNTPCDFSSTSCPAGETCRALGGCPKYGDYNGIACGFGRVYTAWASATPPAGTTGTGIGLRIFSNVGVACPMPEIQVPGGVHLGTACVGSTSTGTLAICNTGTADLVVSAISSSNPRFSVATPSAGYPVTISHDFCFPFQALFNVAAMGSQSANLTIASNDPDTPNTVVTVDGSGAEPDIRVTGSTDFGVASAWRPNEKTLAVCNAGGCDLSVTTASLGCADFGLINNPFPATVSHGSCLDLVIGFRPLLPGERTCALTVASSDPDTPVVSRTLTARTPAFLSLHAGLANPYGSLSGQARQGSTFNLDFVYPVQPHTAWDVRLGFTRFDGRAGYPDTRLESLNANAKYTFSPTAPVRVFLNGGPGLYHFDPGTFEGGLNLGLGINVPAGPRFVIEATYNYHWVVTASPILRYDQVQAGVLVSF
jgi:hypothetical protein